MNRPIKFRAWDKKEKVMQRISDIGWMKDESGLSGCVIILPSGHDQFRPIEDLELIQSTGLLDRNGNEIYENYIVRCFDKSGEVVYDRQVDFFGFRKEIWSEEIQGKTKVEIIGNIYENSELLKP